MRKGFLELLLPSAEQTELLRACLWSGDEARVAWQRWRQGAPDAKRGLAANGGSAKALVALVHDAVRRNDLEAGAADRAAFAAAALAEAQRSAAYEAACARAFAALGSVPIPFLALKGAGLAASVYGEPALRHSHDVDLLIEGADRRRAAEALQAAQFEPAASPRASTDRFLDPSRLPIVLHERLFPAPLEGLPAAEIRARAVTLTPRTPSPKEIAGPPVETLSAADHLVHVCGLAACCASHHPLCWVCDAWHLIEGCPELDWAVALRSSEQARLALPLAAMLGYLARELDAAVPAAVLERLEAAAAASDRRARAAALAGVRAARGVGFRTLMRAASGGRERWEIVRALLLSPP